MAYEANRGMGIEDDDKEAKLERDTQNNANNIRNAADVAMASKNPYAMAAGAGVKVADKITNGKSSEALGKGLAKANQIAPGGRRLQDASNKLNESGASDAVGKAASIKNKNGGEKEAVAGGNADKELAEKLNNNQQRAQNAANNVANNAAQNAQENAQKKSGGGQDSSLPSSSGTDGNSSDNDKKDEKAGGLGRFFGRQALMIVAMTIAPFLILILIIIVIIASVTGMFNDYNDAFGMSYTLGEETGGLDFNSTSKEQEEFLDRINGVKLSYQSQGKNVDAMKIVGIYHSLTSHGVDISYDDVTTSVIEKWANAMFSGNSYSEDTFKNNLINDIFPSYKPGEDKAYYESMANEVFDYVDRYYNLIKKEDFGSNCSESGNCAYDVKGFYIPSRGNVVKNIKIDNLKVRLMECGSPYGNGNDKTPIKQDLVDFESYVAGVAYAEVGPSASEELLKTQMVAARSFALARPTAMGNAAGKKLEQENGQWVLQIASCVSDQVFCNIDLGCSYMGGGDGQGGIVRSGKVAGAQRTRDPLPENHAIRRAAASTQGEVLTNSQGYIISTGYLSSDQKNWDSLASKGLNYKQILLQSYNSGNRNYGATDVRKAACSGGAASSCVSTGDFASWKQGDSRWGKTPMGNSGRTLSQIGCLVTSVSMLIAKSGEPVQISSFNPGTFVEFLNKHGGFAAGGNYIWATATQAVPSFKYQGQISIAGMSKQSKLNKIKEITSQKGVYAVVEVKGNTGQHWVAIDGVNGSTINMMDPSSNATDMWAQYNWANTSTIAYYRVG